MHWKFIIIRLSSAYTTGLIGAPLPGKALWKNLYRLSLEDLLCISRRSNYRHLMNQFNANLNNYEETGRMSNTNDNNISIKEFGEYP